MSKLLELADALECVRTAKSPLEYVDSIADELRAMAMAQGGGAGEGAIEKIALLFTRSGRHFVGKDDRDECMAKAKQAIALAAQPGGSDNGR